MIYLFETSFFILDSISFFTEISDEVQRAVDADEQADLSGVLICSECTSRGVFYNYTILLTVIFLNQLLLIFTAIFVTLRYNVTMLVTWFLFSHLLFITWFLQVNILARFLPMLSSLTWTSLAANIPDVFQASENVKQNLWRSLTYCMTCIEWLYFTLW